MRQTTKAALEGLPTVERISKAAGAFEIGGGRRSRLRIYRMRDAPLERLADSGRISAAQYQAAQKFQRHWFGGLLAGVLHSVDPDRVFAINLVTMSGLPRSQHEVEDRDEYRRAVGVMGAGEHLAVEGVACAELSLQAVGHVLGFRSAFRARTIAFSFFRDGADKLARLWKI